MENENSTSMNTDQLWNFLKGKKTYLITGFGFAYLGFCTWKGLIPNELILTSCGLGALAALKHGQVIHQENILSAVGEYIATQQGIAPVPGPSVSQSATPVSPQQPQPAPLLTPVIKSVVVMLAIIGIMGFLGSGLGCANTAEGKALQGTTAITTTVDVLMEGYADWDAAGKVSIGTRLKVGAAYSAYQGYLKQYRAAVVTYKGYTQDPTTFKATTLPQDLQDAITGSPNGKPDLAFLLSQSSLLQGAETKLTTLVGSLGIK